jgi:hypothetical protein
MVVDAMDTQIGVGDDGVGYEHRSSPFINLHLVGNVIALVERNHSG